MLLTFCSCSSGETGGKGDPEGLIGRMEQEFRSRPSIDANGNRVWNTLGFSRFGISNPHLTTWIGEIMAEERELLSLGPAVVAPVGSALLNPKLSRDLRARLAVLLGRLGEPGAAPFLFKIIDEDPDPLLRECAVTGLGLLRGADLVERLSLCLKSGRVRKQVVHWAMGMCGTGSSRDQALALCDEVLRTEECEDALSGFPAPAITVGSGDRHLRLEAKVTTENENLSLDLWRASHFRSREVVRILISGLRYHNSWVQHMALSKLIESVDCPASLRGGNDYDLHSLQMHQDWADWWRHSESTLRWDEAAAKYVSDARKN